MSSPGDGEGFAPVLSGAGSVLVTEACEAGALEGEAAAFLRSAKTRKYLGVQDRLALISTGQALSEARLLGSLPSQRTGLYVAVGHIPFERGDIEPVVEHSLDATGAFSLERFSQEGYRRAHPLLALRCLPNMPAFHIAANFDVQGPSSVVYPTAGEFYSVLAQARLALCEDEIDVALVVGVAAQRNFLVQHHFERVASGLSPHSRTVLVDAAATLVLERPEFARLRGAPMLAELLDLSLQYTPFDPLESSPEPRQRSTGEGAEALDAELQPFDLGAAAPATAIAWAQQLRIPDFSHQQWSRSGVMAQSCWRALESQP